MSSTRLTSDPQAIPQPLASDSSTQQADIGARVATPDGRVFRYVKNGAVAMVPGKVYQVAAELANHQNLAPTAATAVGDTSITVTLGNTAATLNQYAGGYVLVTVTPGQGYQYLIAGHPAANASATLALSLADPIAVATNTSTTKIDLVPNPYSGVIVSAAPPTGAPVGVAVYPVTALYYGWLQTGGVTNVLADGAVVAGSIVGVSPATVGAAIAVANSSSAMVGEAVTAISTTEYGAVKLYLDQ